MIREKTTEDLRHMTDEEGLILQAAAATFRNGWTESMICSPRKESC